MVLFNTGISGEIPNLSNLQKLEVFKVENCALTGDGFSSLYNVPSLKVLGLAGNEMTGSLEGIGKLLNLEELYISQTSIGGPLPKGMGNLIQLKYIKGSETMLTGTIPSSFGDLKNLVELDLSQSGLSGGIPSDIGALESLTTLVLVGNNLTGKILCYYDSWIVCLIVIISVHIADVLTFFASHLLTGALTTQGGLPSEVGLLTGLEVLVLSNNYFSGTLPPELGNLVSIEYLDLRNNNLSGEVPDGLCIDGAMIQVNCSISCAVDCCTNYVC